MYWGMAEVLQSLKQWTWSALQCSLLTPTDVPDHIFECNDYVERSLLKQTVQTKITD
jgi:hypothetical protein